MGDLDREGNSTGWGRGTGIWSMRDEQGRREGVQGAGACWFGQGRRVGGGRGGAGS